MFDVNKKTSDARIDALAFVVMFYMLLTGLLFISQGELYLYEFDTFETMNKLMSITTWGVIFVVNALLFLVAILIEIDRVQYVLFVISGIMGFFLMSLYALASYDSSELLLQPFRYLLFAGINIAIVALGGIAWHRERKKDS